MKVKSLRNVRLLATPWTAAYQAPPSLGFSRQEVWSEAPLPSPKTFLRTGFKVVLLNAATRWQQLFMLNSFLGQAEPLGKSCAWAFKVEYFGHLMRRTDSLEKS